MFKFMKRKRNPIAAGQANRIATLEEALVDAKDALMRSEVELCDATSKVTRHEAQVAKLQQLLEQEYRSLPPHPGD